jgi:CubicO group peptidase (beta-lactamase class C family)
MADPQPGEAVVQRETPPLLCCWGSRDIETGAPVGPDTLFPICSVTKSFTATGLALLVNEGKLDWNTPVREILPEFRLRDLVATEQATLRDLLTHRTGLPRHDWVHMCGHLDNAGMLAALRHLDPASRFAAPIWQSATLRRVEFRRVRGQPPRAGWVRAALVFSQA